MLPPAWLHVAASVPTALREAVRALLARSGLQPGSMPADPTGYGLVVLDTITPCLLQDIRRASQRATVLLIAVAPCRLSSADLWALLRAGAVDVIRWPTLPAHAEPVCARLERLATVQTLLDSARVTEALVGRSPAWRRLLGHVIELAVFSRSPVLITGESGTGKELIARLIHDLDPHGPRGELEVVDCTTITAELAGSEFFGHERGAFTGALNAREGAFARAHGGTLFLDEIGELPPPLQAQLLRVVQEGKYKRVGGNVWQHTDFRLISATHRDLATGTTDGSFRADLYYRIAGAVCHTPRLAERRDDVLALAAHFQAQHEGPDGGEGFDDAVRQYLLERDYPGNVRDLRRVVSWLCEHHAGGGPITIGDVPQSERPPAGDRPPDDLDARFAAAAGAAIDQGLGLKDIAAAAAECAIRLAVERERGNLHRAAQRLGVTDRALQLRRAHQRPTDAGP